jgi:endogenous inhibitor of DNA gyrase (YacG/DUF329 family)
MIRRDEPQDDRSKTPCPTCGKLVAADAEAYPFCCRRCRTIDLGKWLKGDYVISRPIEQSDLEEE